jgi:hypothetical protein
MRPMPKSSAKPLTAPIKSAVQLAAPMLLRVRNRTDRPHICAQAIRSKYLLTPLARESRPHMPLALLTSVPVRATNGFEVAQGEYQQQNLVK